MKILTEDEMARIDSAAQGMSNLLQMYCQRQDKQCRYEEERYETHCGILWRMRLFVDGVSVGEATRSGRRMAKNVAAWEACKKFGLVVSV
jgi:phage terminase large subunit GpA-like protein